VLSPAEPRRYHSAGEGTGGTMSAFDDHSKPAWPAFPRAAPALSHLDDRYDGGGGGQQAKQRDHRKPNFRVIGHFCSALLCSG
jgi:hypothetical protein